MKKFFTKLSVNKKLFLLGLIPGSALTLLVLFVLALPISILILDKPFFAYKEYVKIDNWDNHNSLRHKDLDGDEKEDTLFIDGCLILSSVSVNEIPKEKQCITPIFNVVDDENLKIGQKAGWEDFSFLTYAIKNSDNRWMFVNKPTFLTIAKAYTIDNQGFIQQTSLPLIHGLYVMSYTATMLFSIPAFMLLNALAS